MGSGGIRGPWTKRIAELLAPAGSGESSLSAGYTRLHHDSASTVASSRRYYELFPQRADYGLLHRENSTRAPRELMCPALSFSLELTPTSCRRPSAPLPRGSPRAPVRLAALAARAGAQARHPVMAAVRVATAASQDREAHPLAHAATGLPARRGNRRGADRLEPGTATQIAFAHITKPTASCSNR